MSIYSVDIEADGPIPGEYSMVALGIVRITPKGAVDPLLLSPICPISTQYKPEALSVSGLTREVCMRSELTAKNTMDFLSQYIHNTNTGKRPVFLADNNGFDWSFINWYFHKYLGYNPFGYSSMNLNSIYKGIKQDLFASIKQLRRTPHDHNPLHDAQGNAEAFIAMSTMYRIRGAFQEEEK